MWNHKNWTREYTAHSATDVKLTKTAFSVQHWHAFRELNSFGSPSEKLGLRGLLRAVNLNERFVLRYTLFVQIQYEWKKVTCLFMICINLPPPLHTATQTHTYYSLSHKFKPNLQIQNSLLHCYTKRSIGEYKIKMLK